MVTQTIYFFKWIVVVRKKYITKMHIKSNKKIKNGNKMKIMRK